MADGMAWLLRLEPDRAKRVGPASSAGLLEQAVRVVGRGPVDWAVQRAHAMAVTIVTEMPQFGGTSDAFDVLRMGAEATSVQSVVRLAKGGGERPATAEALEGLVDFVRRGIGLDAVLRGVRLGHAELMRGFEAECERLVPAAERFACMKEVTDELFAYIDTFSAIMAERYVAEQVAWSTSELAARREMVVALLRDQPADAAAVSRRIGFPLTGANTAFVFWTDAVGADVDPAGLQRTTMDVLRHLPVLSRLVLPLTAGTVWAWVRAEAALEQPLRTAVTVLPSHLHVAVGVRGRGVEGFRRGHAQAVAAASLAQTTGMTEPLVRYEDVELLSLLLEDRDRAATFAARVLGSLWDDGAASQQLRETLGIYLAQQSSTQAAARTLHLARNTVAYRIRRAEQAMGRGLESRVHEVQAALVIADAVHRPR